MFEGNGEEIKGVWRIVKHLACEFLFCLYKIAKDHRVSFSLNSYHASKRFYVFHIDSDVLSRLIL